MDDSDLIPLSYLSQLYYCKRRAALLLVGQYWKDNEFTVSGSFQHRKVHDAGIERRGVRIKLYEMTVFSKNLGLNGKCDCVEGTIDSAGIYLPFCDARYKLFPVEYKHGVIRDEIEYNVQLCAQAMCIEEMYSGRIEEGAVFYIDSHRKFTVSFNSKLRELVASGAKNLIDILATGKIPEASYSPKCQKCSMLEICMPRVPKSSKSYISKLMHSEVSDEEA